MDEKELKTRLKNARENIQNKNFNDALKICEQILQANPKNYMALVFAGRCHVELDNPMSARDCYGRATAIDETQLLAWQGLLQFYEKYCIWDDNCVSCLKRLIALTTEEKKKRDYQFQLATTLARGGRIAESVAEFSALRSLNGDDGWKVQVEEAVIRYVGDAVLFGEKSVDLVKMCYSHCMERALDDDKNALQIKLSHFLIQNNRFTDAYDLFTKMGVSEKYGATFLCDFASLLFDRYMQDCFSETDEELLASLIECFENEDLANGTNAWTSSSIAVSALSDFVDQNWTDIVDTLKLETLRSLKSPFLWYLLAETQLRVHCYSEAITAAEEALRGWQSPQHKPHPIKAALVEANSHLEIGTTTALKRAIQLFKDILQWLRDAALNKSEIEKAARLGLARAEAADGSLEKAIEILQDMKDQSTSEWLLAKASIYLKTGKYDECEAALTKAQANIDDEDDVVKAKFHYLKGRTFWDTNRDKNQAVKEFLQAAKLDSYHADSFYYLGLHYDESNDDKSRDKALKCFERAFLLDGRYKWKLGVALSDSYRKSGAHEKNLALLLEITKSQPVEECSWAWLRLGLEYLSQSKADDAISVLQTVLRLVDTDIRCWECLGEAYALRGSYASAVKAFEKVLELESEKPKIAYARYRMATINLVLQRYETAAQEFRSLMKMDEANLSSKIGFGHALVELAKHYFAEGRLQRSLNLCAEGIRILAPVVVSQPRSPSGWYLLGSALTMVGRYPESELEKMALPDFNSIFHEEEIKPDKAGLLKLGSRCFAQAIQLQPKVAEVWHELGMNLFFQASSDNVDEETIVSLVSQSVNCLKHAIRLDPMKARFWSSLANVAASATVDQPELAQHCFIKSLSLEPHQAAAWTGLGVLYKKYDEIQLAHKCFERAQSVDPDYGNCWIGQAAIAEEVQPKEALDLFRHAVELGNNVQAMLGYGYHVLLTMLDRGVDRESTEYQYAIEHLRAVPVAQIALQKYCFLYPTDPCALNMLGLLLEQERLYTSASSVYLSALEILKKSNKGMSENAEEFVAGNTCRLFGKMGNSAMMRKLAGKMTTKNTFENLCMRGLAFYRLEQYDKAVELYSEAVYASGTKPDQAIVNCAFALIAAKQADWTKATELASKTSADDYVPWVFWTTVSSVLQTASVDMKSLRDGFLQLSKLSTGAEWIPVLAAVWCLYSEKLSLSNAQWLLHLLPYDPNVRFAFQRVWRKSELEWAGSTSNVGLPALAKWQAMAQLKETRRKEVSYAKIRHVYPDMFSSE